MFRGVAGLLSRRAFLDGLGRLAGLLAAGFASLGFETGPRGQAKRPGWPSEPAWEGLRKQIRGRLISVKSPLVACTREGTADACRTTLEQMQNPFYLEELPGATQTTGWLNAWTAQVSRYAVAAQTPDDIVAAVKFARRHGVRLVVKGTGHDYLGRSNASDSLLIWTHEMRKVQVHDSFEPEGGSGPGVPAVSVEAGTRWLEAYAAVTNRHGRYVQGGGCTSVGAAGGFTLGGGFGALSKRYGCAAGSMLEAEVVTADGQRLIANDFQNADLFWALRGGGGGTFGIVTRVTLLTHEMPSRIGGLNGSIRATSDDAFRTLLAYFARFYAEKLNNPSWGENVKLTPENELKLSLAFIDLSEEEARETWKPFEAWLADRPSDYHAKLDSLALPFRELWNLDFWLENEPSMVRADRRPGQPEGQFWWQSNQKAVSEYIYDYQSRWLPLRLFAEPEKLAETLFAASRHWEVSLYVNKGLAGAPPEVIERDRRTCINPSVFEAAGWVLMMASETNAFPQVPGREPDREKARQVAARVSAGMKIIRKATPGAGTYSNEADYHEPAWQQAFWGGNYPKLLSIKKKYDPHNLFRTHHSVGSET